jgi:hypothetical protein
LHIKLLIIENSNYMMCVYLNLTLTKSNQVKVFTSPIMRKNLRRSNWFNFNNFFKITMKFEDFFFFILIFILLENSKIGFFIFASTIKMMMMMMVFRICEEYMQEMMCCVFLLFKSLLAFFSVVIRFMDEIS